MQKSRRIIIISPQPWGKIKVSKHHYAETLATIGCKVLFINPPSYNYSNTKLEISPLAENNNILIADYSIPPLLRLIRIIFQQRLRPIHDFYINKIIIPKISKHWPADEIWSFEPNLLSSLKGFDARIKIFFLADQAFGPHLKKLTASAQLLVSVSPYLLKEHKKNAPHTLLVHHGISKIFEISAKENLTMIGKLPEEGKIKVGYAGNLLMGDTLDIQAIQTTILENPLLEFNFWGPYSDLNNNLWTPPSSSALAFIEFLKNAPNVILHGIATQQQLIEGFKSMQIFWVTLNMKKDKNKGSNSHKIMEYFTTGKVVIGNFVSALADIPELIIMPDTRKGEDLPLIFKRVSSNLSFYNKKELQEKRIKLALSNTYLMQVNRIQHKILQITSK